MQQPQYTLPPQTENNTSAPTGYGTIILGTIVGNIGCAILWLICGFLSLLALGPAIANVFSNITNPLR